MKCGPRGLGQRNVDTEGAEKSLIGHRTKKAECKRAYVHFYAKFAEVEFKVFLSQNQLTKK